jgi:hypothetical protein
VSGAGVRSAAALSVLCLVAAGCGVNVPASSQSGSTVSASSQSGSTVAGAPVRPAGAPQPVVQPPRHHRPVRQPDPYNSPLAAAALVAFTNEYINWNAHTVAADMRLLASQSIGQAHAAMELAAGEVGRDYELQRGGIANSGRVEGVSPLNEPGGEWVIVTRERTTAAANSAYQGLAPAWHVIVARAVELWPGRWAVSLWQPEN